MGRDPNGRAGIQPVVPIRVGHPDDALGQDLLAAGEGIVERNRFCNGIAAGIICPRMDESDSVVPVDVQRGGERLDGIVLGRVRGKGRVDISVRCRQSHQRGGAGVRVGRRPWFEEVRVDGDLSALAGEELEGGLLAGGVFARRRRKPEVQAGRRQIYIHNVHSQRARFGFATGDVGDADEGMVRLIQRRRGAGREEQAEGQAGYDPHDYATWHR